MIITDISAENILKYARLQLRDLPENGIIAVDGPNESGKSTIGETICFALFGRTFSLESEELEKLIRWGETHCSVSVCFRAGDGVHYEVARFLDRDGNQGARLNRVGSEDEPIARGREAVENALFDLLGYGYDEFIESFYLAQREITTPHPHSYAIKAMAGLSTLEYLADEYEQEIEQEGESVEKAGQQVAEVARELDELAIDTTLLPSLEGERIDLALSQVAMEEKAGDLEQASRAYQDAIPRIRATAKSRGWAGFLRLFSFLLAVALFAAWFLITRLPEHGLSQTVVNSLSHLPGWRESFVPWLLYGSIGFALLFLLGWGRVMACKGRIAKFQEASRSLSDKLDALHQDISKNAEETVEAADPETQEDPVQQGESGLEPEIDSSSSERPARPDDGEIAQVGQRIALSLAEPSEARDIVGRELAWMRWGMQQQQERIGGLDQAIKNEKERLDKSDKLHRMREDFEQKVADHERRIQLRELAGELLQGASSQLSQRFNRELRNLVGRTLPLFTEGRYEHLQIDEDLTVRVFSNEKRDFMALEEISSGTQRQIMLAVRLALSQELVNSAVVGKQFVFLDEPFAFFDQERTRNALRVLPDLSEEITQVWIVAQAFPADQTFDVPIACSRESDVLPAHG